MAPTSLPNAKTDIYNCFASDAAGTPVTALNSYVGKVYAVEPRPGDLIQANGKATITLWTSGIDPTNFSFILRVYQHVDHDVFIAQTNLDAAAWAAEQALTSEFERTTWAFQFDPTISLMLAETTVMVPRSDF